MEVKEFYRKSILNSLELKNGKINYIEYNENFDILINEVRNKITDAELEWVFKDLDLITK